MEKWNSCSRPQHGRDKALMIMMKLEHKCLLYQLDNTIGMKFSSGALVSKSIGCYPHLVNIGISSGILLIGLSEI